GPEQGAELRVAIVQDISMLAQSPRAIVHRIPRHLLHPRLGRMPSHTAQAYAPALQVQKKQHIIGGQGSPGEYFDREEIDSSQAGHLFRKEVAREVRGYCQNQTVNKPPLSGKDTTTDNQKPAQQAEQ